MRGSRCRGHRPSRALALVLARTPTTAGLHRCRGARRDSARGATEDSARGATEAAHWRESLTRTSRLPREQVVAAAADRQALPAIRRVVSEDDNAFEIVD